MEYRNVAGELKEGYQTVDEKHKAAGLDKINKSHREKGSVLWRIANKIGAGSLIAALAIGGTSVVKNEGIPQATEDVASGTADLVQNTGEFAKDRVDTLIRDIKTGSPDKVTPWASRENPNQSFTQGTNLNANPTSNSASK